MTPVFLTKRKIITKRHLPSSAQKNLLTLAILLTLQGCAPDDETLTPAFFQPVPAELSGIDFTNSISENDRENILRYPYYYNGGGVAIGDLNGDELPDIYFTGNMAGDRLYYNQGGLRFKDATIKAGILRGSLWTTGVTLVDINNDGWLDIYVCRSGTGTFRNNLLYINNQNGGFSEQGKAYGLNDNGYSVQSYFFDYDRDGDLDLYLVNHSVRFFEGQEKLFAMKDNPEPEEADKLFRNTGNGSFEDVSEQAGINHFAFGLSAAIADFNNDGYPDIYAASDFFEPDFFYLNNGDGTFSDVLPESMGHTSFSSMGSDAADFNNDGHPDLFVCDMQAQDNFRKKAHMASMDVNRFNRIVAEGYHYQYMQNTLQLNSGMGRFSEIAELAGVSETDWSWAPLFFDVDRDGWKDLFVSNGIRRDFQYKDILLDLQKTGRSPNQVSPMNLIERFPVQELNNYFFRNEGNLSYSNQSDTWGVNFEGFSTGASYGDLDLDGDLDLVLNNIDRPASLFESMTSVHPKAGNWLQIRLRGTRDNFYGVGAKVEIRAGSLTQYQHVQPSRGFQSSVDPTLTFGLADATTINEVRIYWPDGSQSILTDVPSNQLLECSQEDAQNLDTAPGNQAPFSEIAEELNLSHYHQEKIFDDYAKEVLLPHKYSQLGPDLAVADVNGDGLEDFFIGGAAGYTGRLYLQSGNGTFSAGNPVAFKQHRAFEDTGILFLDCDRDGDQDLYIASGSNEWEPTDARYQDRLYINDGRGNFDFQKGWLPDFRHSTGKVSSADIDRDGDLDLFVAGRQHPGHYPLPPPSYLLLNEGDHFRDVTAQMAPDLSEIGMVSDALWTDIDQDQDQDLVLTGEWMPITMLKNEAGKLTLTRPAGLEKSHGWWYALAGADFDGDGDTDFIGGNLGLNYKYQATPDEPFQVYAHDFDQNESLDIVLGYFNGGELYPLRGRQCSSEQIPGLKEKFPSYASFARSSLRDIYGSESLDAAYHAQVYTFASSYIENLGQGQFQLRALPPMSQFSSVNDFIIDDFNDDGHPDVLLAGNMYHSEVETARNDASLGLILEGAGDGTFEVIPPHETGFFAPGDVKSLARIKTAGHGTCVLVGNNAGRLLVYTRH